MLYKFFKSLGLYRRAYNDAMLDAANMLSKAAASFPEDCDMRNLLILCGQELKISNKINGERVSNAVKAFKGIPVDSKNPANEPKEFSKPILH
jgi:hypothetical protein